MQTNLATTLARVEELEEELLTLHSPRDKDLVRFRREVRAELESLYSYRLERLCQAVNHCGKGRVGGAPRSSQSALHRSQSKR